MKFTHGSLFLTCPKGLEPLLAEEVAAGGGHNVRQTVAGVHCEGQDVRKLAYNLCLWSRLANKVLLPLDEFSAATPEALYEGVKAVDWAAHLAADGRLRVDFVGTSETIRNTQFGAQKVKDALVDQLRRPDGTRPTVDRHEPDLWLNVRLHKGRARVSLDLAGDSLHKRGYRQAQVAAPLKENLAAALLLRMGWPQLATEGRPLLDPMCGGGTLLIEGALMAADIAPGLLRPAFAFERWAQHDSNLWEAMKEEARARQARGLERPLPEIRGYDVNPRAVEAAQQNLEAAGLAGAVRVSCKPLEAFTPPTHRPMPPGLVLTNPPYGERLGDEQSLLSLYQTLGERLKTQCQDWRAGVFTGNPSLIKAMGLRWEKKYKLFNGTIPSELFWYEVGPAAAMDPDRGLQAATRLTDGARMVVNRLKKNRRALAKWLANAGTDCYRLYDADLPEYAAAVDIYGDAVHIQEYQAPKAVDSRKADERFRELQQAVLAELDVDPERISIKQRRRTKGRQQYQPADEDPFARLFQVREGPANLWVNLWSYLDTGLFLDHRLVRRRVAGLAAGKRLLNLFCYTATATVQAALAGAAGSVSVDMSNTYLQWAERNFTINNLGDRHQLVRADCLVWLEQCRQGFDVILLDPPSFSNSKRMRDILDIQRDHVKLIRRCMELLNPGGTLVFSTNLRRFKIDAEALRAHGVEDISAATIDRDFQRNRKIHQCFLITHRS